jgi:hypothetical protein
MNLLTRKKEKDPSEYECTNMRHRMLRAFRAPIKRMTQLVGIEIKKIRKFSAKDLVFLHIGKNAGTQIRYLSSVVNDTQNQIRIINYGHALKLKNLPESVPYFFSIRNPVTRFKSAFYSRKRFQQRWASAEKIAFADFEHANDLAEALFSGSDTGTRAFWAMTNITHVNSDQFDWLENCGDLFTHREPVFIIRQENFESDFKVLLQKLRLSIDWNDLNIAPKQQRSHSFDYIDTPELSPLAVSNLELWYKRDCEFYRTCVEWIESKNQTSIISEK